MLTMMAVLRKKRGGEHEAHPAMSRTGEPWSYSLGLVDLTVAFAPSRAASKDGHLSTVNAKGSERRRAETCTSVLWVLAPRACAHTHFRGTLPAMDFAQLKRLVRHIVPKEAIRAFHRYRRAAEHARNAARTPEQVFSEIYRRGTWGKEAGQPFFSGTGSSTQSITEPYVVAMTKYLESVPGGARVVDLGCGDFSIGRQLLPHCKSYVGVDVVPDLIRHLNADVKDARARFMQADIIDGALPDGDICLIRQVLQHLSNAQIRKVLAKLDKYDTVFITEHYPSDDVLVVPNKDKVHGGGIRLFEDSAVYLDKEPFNFFPEQMQLFLERPDDTFEGLFKPGAIRTFKFELKSAPR